MERRWNILPGAIASFRLSFSLLSAGMLPAEWGAMCDPTREYQDIIIGEAMRMRARINRTIELDELVALATEGLLGVTDRIDATRSRGERRAFVRLRVRGHLCDSVGNLINMPRKAWRRFQQGALEARCEPREAGAIDRDYWTMCPPERPRTVMARVIDGHRARQALELLPPRLAELIFHIYFEDRSLGDAAALIGVSPSRASRLRQRALEHIRSNLADREKAA